MIQKFWLAVTQDNNSRLHRTPFLLLWIASFGLAWLHIYVYENPFLKILCDLAVTLKGGFYRTEVAWREDLFIGFVIGVTLGYMQTWLIRRRYGFVPRYWMLATVVGAMIGGLGYLPLGVSMGGFRIWHFQDMVLWFAAMNVMQSLILARTHRHSWLIAGVGILTACMVALILSLLGQYLRYQQISVVIATAIQAVGTGLVMMYLMAHPRQGIVPKREDLPKPKRNLNKSMSRVTFVVLWITLSNLGLIAVVGVDTLSRTFNLVYKLPHVNITYETWAHYSFSTIYIVFLLTTLGIVMGLIQHWLIKYYVGQSIRHWHWFTALGWFVVGMLPHVFLNEHFTAAYNTPQVNIVVTISMFVIPTLMQAILMNRVKRWGSLWAGTGLLAGLIYLLLFGHSGMIISSIIDYQYPSTLFMRGFFLSMVTGIAFVWIMSHGEQSTTKQSSPFHL